MINATLGPEKALGDFISMKTTRAGHLKGLDASEEESGTGATSFADMLSAGLKDVNAQQINSADLSVKALADPTSVNAEDVTIAMTEASISLEIAKNVIDRVLRAYQTLTTLR